MSNNPNNTSGKVIKDMSGYIHVNEQRANDRQPQWRGKIRVQGKEFLLSLWLKEDGKMMSVSVTDPEQMQSRPENARASSSAEEKASSGSASTPENFSDPFGDLFSQR